MLLRIEQQTEYSYATSSKKQLQLFICCFILKFFNVFQQLLCKSFSCFTFFIFLFLLAVCTVQPHFAAPLQPAALAQSQNRQVAATPSGVKEGILDINMFCVPVV